jgi:asparagine synthase (glutamine-hydrolysing)
MCGIIGIIDKSGQTVNETELLAARDLVSHRGPDGAGTWRTGNVGFGHRRLAILGIGDKGNQPFAYRHLTVVHNGEIYNYLEIRDLLKMAGYRFETETDTEVIAAAYCHWGTACVEQFNGIWAFAIYDADAKLVFCSRDRFGVKPFYYSTIAGKFCFASEIKQFTKITGWKAKMNEQRCKDWLILAKHDQSEETLFDDVFQLMGGHNLIFDINLNNYKVEAYYEIREKIKKINLPFDDVKKQFTDLLFNSVQLQLRSDVKIGITLSGGLDSSSISAIITNIKSHTPRKHLLDSFSACFKQKDYNEIKFIDAVVEENGIKSHKIYPDSKLLLDNMKQVTWFMDEPILNPSDITHFLVFKKAKEDGVKVNLCGQGADEILAGYDAHYPVFWLNLLQNNPLKAICEIVGFTVHHPATMRRQLIRKLENLFKKDASQTTNNIRIDNLLDLSILFIETTVLPYILHSEDRHSMANSIESRVPFLDHRLVEFCLSIKDEYKIKNGKRKYLLRESMKDLIPKIIYTRYDKIGFETPIGKNFQKEMSMLTHEINDISKIPFLNDFIVKNNSERWRKFAFLVWYKTFFRN